VNKLDEEIQEKLSTKIFYSGLALFLLFTSISLCLMLISFSPDDPSWGFKSNKNPINFYNVYGAWISGFIIRELGIFPGFLTSIVLFIWSLKLFNRSNFNFIKLKCLFFFLMIFFSSIGGAYFEDLLYNDFQLKISIINQNGLSEWVFLKLASEIAQILNTSQLFTKLITALSSLIISLIMLVWILSLGFQETKFLKFLLRPFFFH